MTPTSPPSRSARRADRVAVASDHGRERAVDDRADADQVEAALAREREVVDVEDRELRPVAGEELRRVGRRRRLADVERDAGVVVVAVGERRVDAGVHGVGLEIEHEGRLVRGARFSTVVAAAGNRQRREDGRQRRGEPSHTAGELSRAE